MHRVIPSIVFVAVLAFALSPARACRECSEQKAGLHLGDFKLLGNGTVRSWVRLDEQGHPIAVGITMTETALEGLAETAPADPHEEEYELNLPPQAAAIGIDHIGLNWNPEGHIPPGIYDTPHFDVHFYLISREQREQIVRNEENLEPFHITPAASFIPEGYIFAPDGEEARMGAHWVDISGPEFNGHPFTATYIYGFYEGAMVFYEPMVTRELLASRPSLTLPIKQPQAVQKEGFYPTEWCITHDQARKEITIALQGLKHRTSED